VSDPDETAVLPRITDDTTTESVPPPGTSSDDTAVIDAIPSGGVTAKDDEATPSDEAAVVGTAAVGTGFGGARRALTQLSWLASGLLMAAVAIFRADRPGLWADELASWGMTTVPWRGMWPLLRSTDMVNGPYYYLLHAWTLAFGSSDRSLRIPSVLAMVVAAALVAALGARLSGPRAGILAGVLFAVFPVTSRYAQEVRGYAFVVCFATLATYLLVAALERGRWRWFVAPYALAVALAGLFNAVALVLLVAHLVTVLVVRRRSLPVWLVAAVLGAAPTAGLLWLARGQRQQVSWITTPDLRSLATLPNELFGLTIVGGCVLVLAALAVSPARPAVVYTAWALVPAVLLFAGGQYTTVWLPRYLLFTLPAWALLAATTLARVPLVRGLLVLAAVALVSVPAQLALRQPAGHTQDTRLVATIIATNEEPGDGAVYGMDDPGGGWVTRDVVDHYLPAGSRPTDLLVTQQPRTNGKVLAVECTAVAKCLAGAPRVWVVRQGTFTDPVTDLGGSKEEALRLSYTTTKVWHPTGMTLALLIRKAA
jgi:mannosyltransferase